MRHHASDPQWMPEVIRREGGWPEMRWNRWSDWQVGDPRWRVHRLDTSTLAIAMIAEQLAHWITEERVPSATRRHPLANWAAGALRSGE